jgi:hypothetical protein
VDAALSACHVWVTAQDYVPYDQHIDLTPEQVGQDIFIGKTRWDGPHPYDIYLPALTPVAPPWPAVPSVEKRVNIQTNFMNLRDSRGAVQFSPFIGGYPVARQDDWIANELKAGSTHMAVSINVNGYGSLNDPEFKPVHFYKENKHAELVDLLTRIVGKGLLPIVFFDSGDSYPGDDYFNGLCDWWNMHLAKFTEYCVFVCGWECVNGGYSSHDYNAANLIMRSKLGPRDKAVLGCHLSPGRGTFGSHASSHYPQDEHSCELDDPWFHQGEPDCWKSKCGPEFAVFLFQSEVARNDEFDEFGQPKWWDRTLDTLERFLPAGTPIPGSETVKMYDRQGNLTTRDGYAGGPKSADWFGSGPRPALCFFEAVAYDYIRGKCDSEYARTIARKAQSFGFKSFGNGLP